MVFSRSGTWGCEEARPTRLGYGGVAGRAERAERRRASISNLQWRTQCFPVAGVGGCLKLKLDCSAVHAVLGAGATWRSQILLAAGERRQLTDGVRPPA
jgi:hypothetical protein